MVCVVFCIILSWHCGLSLLQFVFMLARWRHQMETFSVLLALFVGNSPVTGEFPSQRPVTRSFDDFFDMRLNKRLSKQPKRRWFQMPSRSLWRQCNVYPRGIVVSVCSKLCSCEFQVLFIRRVKWSKLWSLVDRVTIWFRLGLVSNCVFYNDLFQKYVI